MFLLLLICINANAQDNGSPSARNVQVDAFTRETTVARPDTTNYVPTPKEDAIITNSIKSHIKASKTLSKLNVRVNTRKGVVTFSGHIDSDSQADSLIQLAQSIIGVKDVDASKLTIKASHQPLSDMLITAKIKGLFIREKIFGTKDINAIDISVETKNGVVYLTGAIDNKQQIKNAIKLAQTVQGVKRVEYYVKQVTTPADKKANNQ